jgi:glycerophosphoryl diester phosphodiesterase
MIPVLIAHRGYMEKFPENTLSSISAALEAGACMVEFDVQMDMNGQLVVLHDDNFKRTAGMSLSVFRQQDYAGISVHEPNRFADAFNPEPVPMLTQVVELLVRYPAATAFVEIKDESLDQWGMEKVVDKVLACIEPARHQCVIIADSLDALLYTNKKSDHKIGWVIHRYDDYHRELADKHVPDFLICNYRRISGDLWPGSWQWMLYDISNPELAMKWAQKGVELVETRDIGGMLKHPLLQQRACNHKRV